MITIWRNGETELYCYILTGIFWATSRLTPFRPGFKKVLTSGKGVSYVSCNNCPSRDIVNKLVTLVSSWNPESSEVLLKWIDFNICYFFKSPNKTKWSFRAGVCIASDFVRWLPDILLELKVRRRAVVGFRSLDARSMLLFHDSESRCH